MKEAHDTYVTKVKDRKKVAVTPHLSIEEKEMASPARKKNIVWRAIEEFPGQTAQLASVPLVVGSMAIVTGFNGFKQIEAAFASGSPLAAVSVAVVALYTLQAASAVSLMKEGIRASDHDKSQAAKTDLLDKKLEMQMKSQAQETEQLNLLIEEVLLRLDRQMQYQLRRNSDREPWKNTPEVWDNFAPGSTLSVVNGQLRFDVVGELGPDGVIRRVPDFKRLLVWVKRHSAKGIGRANFVIFIDDAVGTKPISVTPQIAAYLTAFRAVKKMAAAYNIELYLDRVRFYVQKGSNARQSFFICAYAIGQKPAEFVASYSDFGAMFNLPRTLLDDDVDVNYSADAVLKFQHLADVLMAGVPTLSLDSLEERYGHLVRDDWSFDPSFVRLNPLPAEFSMRTEQIVENGDHFIIPRNPTKK